MTGIVLPLVGPVLTLGFLIYNLLKVQAPSVQWFTVGGVVIAGLFAFVAGRWSPVIGARNSSGRSADNYSMMM